MLEPVEIQIKCMDGQEKTFIMSKFPAIAGREIICKYPLSAAPKVGDYAVNEEIMIKLMGYVAVPQDSGVPLRLSTRALIDNHVPDYEALMKLEKAMLEYNSSFFKQGLNSILSGDLRAKAQLWILKTLIPLLGQLLDRAKQPSENSKKS